jgi:hypothetical protein
MKFRPLHIVIALVVAMMFCCALQLGCCPGALREGLETTLADSAPVHSGESEGVYTKDLATQVTTFGTPDAPAAPSALPSAGLNVAPPQPSYSRAVTGPRGEQILATHRNTVTGVSRDQIPAGQDGLYILKSEIVPPVCPACPSGSVCPRDEPCPPCPACARCPEPAFECKKVPNYTTSRQAFPVPILNDFSTFGM